MSRILLTGFCALPGPDRAGVQMRHVLEALARHHTVDALVARHGEQAYVERLGNARILRVPLHDGDPSARVDTFRRALKRQLEGAEYDIIHVRDGWAGTTVLELQSLFGYRTVFDAARAPLADAPLMDANLASQLAQAEQRCLLQADRVIVPTEEARGYLLGTRPGGVHVVPPGVDVDRFDWDEPPLGVPIVLCAGTLEPGRGIRVLLRAMTYVLQDMDARLIVAGALEPEFRGALEQAVVDLGLTGRVDLMGEVDHLDMPELIARATVCVAPSACESRTQPMALYPTKILEYMACRRAVVAPRRGTTAMLIRNATHGLLFTPGDPADLARTITLALHDHELRGRLANAGYQLVRQFHTASGTRRMLRQLYRDLTDSPAGREPAYSQVITDQNPALAGTWTDPREITETNRLDSFDALDSLDEPRFMSVDTDSSITPVTTSLPDARPTIEMTSPLHDAWGHETDETELTTVGDATGEHEPDEWIVPDWDRSMGWKSLFDADEHDEGTPLDGTRLPPEPVLGMGLVAGEIMVHTPPPEHLDESEPSFTAVSVLLGTHTEDMDTPDE